MKEKNVIVVDADSFEKGISQGNISKGIRNSTMRRLHVLGSSHVAWILKSVIKNSDIMCNFRVSGRVKPGAKFQNLDFPEWMLQEFET